MLTDTSGPESITEVKEAPRNKKSPPDLVVEEKDQETAMGFTGYWNIRSLSLFPEAGRKFKRHAATPEIDWKLDEISALDSAGA